MTDDGDEGLTRSQKRYRARKAREAAQPKPESNVVQLRATDSGVEVPDGGVAEDRGEVDLVQVHLGVRWSKIVNAVRDGEYTWDKFCTALTSEELARGQLMDKNGKFSGRPPSLVPTAFYRACVKELMGRGSVEWKRNYLGAIEAMTEIAQDKTAKASDRLKAAQFVVERMEGKVPDRLEVATVDPWQEGIEGLLTDTENLAISRATQYLNRQKTSTTGDSDGAQAE